ncbi:MAG: nucleotidyltransferase [Lachnospiraceae bacterium]|nr:nucleotidyltransferase [Lachnospiraceae bacterium]
MKVCGIVSEYNPFHNGHKFHIEKAKASLGVSHVVCVMSGNFVQRGEPACFDKWLRAKAALLSGADMVIELPVLYSSASAEFFASAAVKLISDTGIASSICFGSESSDMDSLKETATLLSNESPEMKMLIKSGLDSGISFQKAREKAINTILGESSLLSAPNDILALEYIKAISKLSLPLKPYAIKREGSEYNSLELSKGIASASAIRKKLDNLSDIKNFVPEESFLLMDEAVSMGLGPVYPNDFGEYLQYCLRSLSPSELCRILDVTEGLENRILEKSQDFLSFNFLADEVKSKRYARTKIMRALIHIVLGIKKEDLLRFNLAGFSPYIRVLGFRKKSETLIKEMSKKSLIPVITSFKQAKETLDENSKYLLSLEERATNIYSLSTKYPSKKTLGRDYTEPVIVI